MPAMKSWISLLLLGERAWTTVDVVELESEKESLTETQVDEFGDDDEYESEEIVYVTLDLGTIEPTLVPTSTEYRLIGLDTPTPFLQLSGTVFKGQHDMLLGTELLFTEAKGDQDRSKKYVAPLATTEHRIRFREIRLIPNTATSQSVASASGENNAMNEDKVVDPSSSVQSEEYVLDVITGLRKQTRRKVKASKEKDKRAKKAKRSDGNDAPITQELENEATSLPQDDAMDVDN